MAQMRYHGHLADLTGCAALADDSGLCVDALDGAPGVYSARYAGEPTDDHRNNMKLLDALEGVTDRSAQFVSVICYIDQNGEAHYFRGECAGSIGFEELGKIGFGYDRIFMVNGRAYAEMTGEEKDAISHRGNAIRLLADFLKGVQTPVIVDQVIADKLLPYAEALAKGQQSAESAVQAAESDLRLYLAERG